MTQTKDWPTIDGTHVPWGGSVASTNATDADSLAIHALKLKADDRVDLALFAVGDGMTCAVKW